MNLENTMEVLQVVGAVVIALPPVISALIAIFVLIPGDQPEKTLKDILDQLNKLVVIIEKVSRKKV